MNRFWIYFFLCGPLAFDSKRQSRLFLFDFRAKIYAAHNECLHAYMLHATQYMPTAVKTRYHAAVCVKLLSYCCCPTNLIMNRIAT